MTRGNTITPLLTTPILIILALILILTLASPGHQQVNAAGTLTEIGLNAFEGPNGYPLVGAAKGDLAGISTAPAGDVNGDGLDDFIIGAGAADPNGKQSAGVSYVVFGRVDKPTSLQLGSMPGDAGFRIVGINTGDQAGQVVSGAGDVNGDGYDDLLIGAPGVDLDEETEDVGAAYLVYGAAAFSPIIYLSQLDGSSGTVLLGVAANQRTGASVSSAGDVNRDGYADLLVGAPGTQAGGKDSAGVGYVVFGKSSFPAVFDLGSLNGTNGVRLSGNELDAEAGNAVAGAGDLNRDGFDDVAIAAWKASRGAKGEVGVVYVVFGQSGFPANIALSKLNGSDGFKILGVEEGDRAGRSVAAAGDANGDGYDDLILSAPFADSLMGAAYVVYGKASFGASTDLATLNGTNGFRLVTDSSYDQFGFDVATAGDVNGDGRDDLLIGASSAGEGIRRFAGEAYVVLSKPTTPALVDLTTLPPDGGLQFNGEAGGDQAGQNVSSAGDVNGDGYGDFLVSAPRSGFGEEDSVGHTYLIYGGATLGLPLLVTHPGQPTNDTLTGTAAKDFMVGHRGNDIIDGLADADVLIGAAGSDYLTGGPGADFLIGGNGTDTASYASSSNGVTVNLLTKVAQGGDAQGDILRHIENLVGSTGNDKLTGNALSNSLEGLDGDDELTGGIGNDLFVFGDNTGSDTINDFVAGAGSPDIMDFAKRQNVMDMSDLTVAQQGSDTVITLPGGDTIRLLGVSSTTLHSDDYRFAGSPVAMDDTYQTPLNTKLSVNAPGVLANDQNNSGNPLQAIIVDGASNGSVNLKSNGSFDYEPDPGFRGTDSFTYRADNGLASNLAVVEILVTGVAPTANDDRYATDIGEPLTVSAPGILANDTNPGNEPLKAVLVQGPISGQLTLQSDGSFVYTPEVDYGIIDSFTYVATNGLTSNEAEVIIEIGSTTGPLDYGLYLPAVTAD